MSLAYCYYCLERIDFENENCKKHGDEVIYGEGRRTYLQGYRDAKAGNVVPFILEEEENI